jgi:hypothetical protein
LGPCGRNHAVKGAAIVYEVLFWVYMLNAVLLINHEIDSAYWKEWELFRLSGGITLFLLLHFPMLFLILYGLVLVHRRSPAGLVISLVLSAGGLLAFLIHMYFLKKGRDEFRLPISLFILYATMAVSVVQASLAIRLLF